MDMNLKPEDHDRAEEAEAQTRPDEDLANPAESATTDASTKTPTTRERSQIAFPWYDLDTAIGVARVIHDAGGIGVSRDQLAGQLGISPTAGNFSIKVGAARMYGLVEVVQSKFQLSQLGYAVLSKDESAEKTARAQAFLNVPLYRRAYDEFRGKPLPPRPTGLENVFGQFGVPAKSRAIARQVFDRSARQSGFSTVDPDRLIEPVIVHNGAAERQPAEANGDHVPSPAPANGVRAPTNQEVQTLELDELVRGLLRRLPKAGETWTPEAKAKWLRALSQNLDYVCEIEGDKIVVISVKSDEEA